MSARKAGAIAFDTGNTAMAVTGRRRGVVGGLGALIIAAYFTFMSLFAFNKPLLGSWPSAGAGSPRPAVASILTGTVSSVLLIALSPTIQVDVLCRHLADIAHARWFMPLAFAVAVAVSAAWQGQPDGAAYETMRRRMILDDVVDTLPV